MESTAASATTLPFAGPFAGGPPAEELIVRRPSLTRFGPTELVRIVVVCTVLGGSLLVAWLGWQSRWLYQRLRPRFGHSGGNWTGESRARALADGTVNAFTRLGPMFAKLGQLIASAPGLFPHSLSHAARRCLDEMPPFRAKSARALLERELGRPVDELFAWFDDVPLAAGSVAQVHACRLPDGREAVVKLRRPGIERRLMVSLRIMFRLAQLLDRWVTLVRLMNLTSVVRELHRATCQELNFALEAHHQQRFAEAIGVVEGNEHVVVPEVYWDYCARGVICMQRLHGAPLDKLEELAAQHIDGSLALRRAVKAWLEAVITRGLFHGDMHAGNLWVLDDGRTAFLDFGLMGELVPEWRALLRDGIFTCAVDRDFSRLAGSLRRLGVLAPDVGTDAQLGWAIGAVFGPLLDRPVAQLNSRQIIGMLLTMARQYRGNHPAELTLFTKQVLYLERHASALAPGWVITADRWVLRDIFPAAPGLA